MNKTFHTITRWLLACILIATGAGFGFELPRILPAHAGSLTDRSDTLSTSAPLAASDHTIVFTTDTIVPVSGYIIIRPQSGMFSIPAGLDFTDVDVAVNGTEKLLGNISGSGSGSQMGVHVTAGTTGLVRINLNNTDTISGGSIVRIKIGTNAIETVSGNQQITSPTSIGSYSLLVTTANASEVAIDSGTIGLAVVESVGITTTEGATATPVMSPTAGTFVGYVDVSISTTTTGATIYYTTNGTTPTTGSTVYSSTLTFTSTTTLKAIAVKSGLDNSSVASETYTRVVAPPPPPPPPPSGGGSPGGSGIPPNGPVIIYTDNQGNGIIDPAHPTRLIHRCPNGAELILDLPANFTANEAWFTILCLPASLVYGESPYPGTAIADTVFDVSATDKYNTPLTTLNGTVGITLSYTTGHLLGLSKELITPYSHPPTPGGPWTLLPDSTINLGQNSYGGKFERFGLFLASHPKRSPEEPKDDCNARKADLNCDGLVNLTDLSILLYNWGAPKNNPRADINKDGLVNIVDFSILLYWWTG